MESGRVFFDVDFDRNEILLDKRRELGISIRLGFQPSTSASSRSSAEINQNRFMFSLGFAQRCINVLIPIHSHTNLREAFIWTSKTI
jgi:hypothetical protein